MEVPQQHFFPAVLFDYSASFEPFSVSQPLGSASGFFGTKLLETLHPLFPLPLLNPMDAGAWWATVHGVAKSRAWLSTAQQCFSSSGVILHPLYVAKFQLSRDSCIWISEWCIKVNFPVRDCSTHTHTLSTLWLFPPLFPWLLHTQPLWGSIGLCPRLVLSSWNTSLIPKDLNYHASMC